MNLITVECPKCKKTKSIPLPIPVKPEGITTVMIPLDIVCEHQFQVFLDRSLNIRGYLTTDFNVVVTSDKNLINPPNLVQNFTLDDLIDYFGEDSFTIFLEGMTSHSNVVFLGISPDKIGAVKAKFYDAFPTMEKYLFFVDRAEFNSNWKTKIFSYEFRFNYVFDFEIGTVIKTPEKNRRLRFGHHILRDVKKTNDPDEQVIILNKWNDRVQRFTDHVYNLIKENPKIKAFEIIQTLKKIENYDEKVIPLEIIVQRLTVAENFDYSYVL